jgi:putative transposase
MKRVAKEGWKSKRKKRFGEIPIVEMEDYQEMTMDTKAELIQRLIPLGLMHIAQLLQEEVKALAGERYDREGREPGVVRYGNNPGSVRLGGQRMPLKIPRVRNLRTQQEVELKTLEALRNTGETDETLFRRVFCGISCRDYERAAEAIPGALGLSASTISRHFVKASARQLQEFQERSLSEYDLVALVLDGKTLAEDTMVIALGVTLGGQKVPLGFVQTSTENGKSITQFLQGLVERGLRMEQGVLVVVDGSKGLLHAVKKTLDSRAVIQRCQWHKRENVISYLPKGEQDYWRRRLQQAYQRPTYAEAKGALEQIKKELETCNLNAAASLEEGWEETLSLHRLKVFAVLGHSLKTTNALESIHSQIEARCRKVSFWKTSHQKQRWLAACLLEIEPRLYRIHGYQHLPLLRQALQQELGIQLQKEVA